MPTPAADPRRALALGMPGYRVDSLTLLGQGQDNLAYEVNGSLIVRFAISCASGVEREARLLAEVAAWSPLPVPSPAFVLPALGCLAYPKLPGTPLLDLPATERSAFASPIAAALRGLLAALHAIPASRLTGLVEIDDQPLAQWLAEAAALYPVVASRLPPPYRPGIEAFLAAAPPAGDHPLVFSHNDLGAEHVLVDPATGTVTGILDWTDAALVDPAHDLGLLYRDLGPAIGPVGERGIFYARCGVLEDIAYGLETGRTRYVDNGLNALPWLF